MENALAVGLSRIGRIDLSQISDADLTAEYMRRIAARRDPSKFTGRKKACRPCPNCGREFGAREMRLHLPECRKQSARLYWNDREVDGHPLMLQEKLNVFLQHPERMTSAPEIWLLNPAGERVKHIGGVNKIPTNIRGRFKYESWLKFSE